MFDTARRVAVRAALVGIMVAGGMGFRSVAQARHTADTVTVTYWNQWVDPVSKGAVMKVISAFEKANPSIQIKEVDVTSDQKILTSITGGRPPDAASMWSITNLGDWAARGAIMNLIP